LARRETQSHHHLSVSRRNLIDKGLLTGLALGGSKDGFEILAMSHDRFSDDGNVFARVLLYLFRMSNKPVELYVAHFPVSYLSGTVLIFTLAFLLTRRKVCEVCVEEYYAAKDCQRAKRLFTQTPLRVA
jgi:hypothetical protein